MGTSDTVKVCRVHLLASTIQFLCISVPKTLLHVTLKGRAEIPADIFARLLLYFRLPCNNSRVRTTLNLSSLETSSCTFELHLIDSVRKSMV